MGIDALQVDDDRRLDTDFRDGREETADVEQNEVAGGSCQHPGKGANQHSGEDCRLATVVVGKMAENHIPNDEASHRQRLGKRLEIVVVTDKVPFLEDG